MSAHGASGPEEAPTRAFEAILYQVRDSVATVTFNRPERMNAFSRVMGDEILSVLDDISNTPGIRAVILTGAGRGFSAGGDVRTQGEVADRRTAMEARDWLRQSFQKLTLGLQQLERPTIAAVNGAAVGGGMDLACACDFRIASEEATFASVFARLGLFPGTGGSWLLPRIVGIEKACELIWLGETVDAREALRIGLVGRVVPGDRLLEEAGAFAAKLAQMAPIAIRLSKSGIYRGLQQDLATHLEWAATAESITLTSEDHREGLQASQERRKPVFRGR